MPEIAQPWKGNSSWGRRLVLGVAALAMLTGISMISSDPAEAACSKIPPIVCHTTDGTVRIQYSAQELEFFLKYSKKEELIDCAWDVTVTYGDGKMDEFTFAVSEGLDRSHTYEEPGEYHVSILAANGKHSGTEEPCEDFPLTATVIYTEPSEEEPPEEEGGGKEEPPPGEQPGGGGPTGGSTGGPPGAGVQGTESQHRRGTGWRRCRGNVLSRKVRCPRALKIVRIARATFLRAGDGTTRTNAAGFSCRVLPRGKRRLACRRQNRLVLAPLKRP
ncbi:MAG TPA: hypothetical protein VGF04_04145 [Solirubrobacterales bacterium]